MDISIVDFDSISPQQMDAWQRLFESEPESRFYHHPHWYQCLAEHLSEHKPRFALLTIENELRMVFPLCSSVAKNRRAHPSHDHLSLNDVLLHSSLKTDASAFVDAMHFTLEQTGDDWNDWQIANVPGHSAIIKALATFDKGLINSENEDNTGAVFPTIHASGNEYQGNWFVKQTRFSASFDCTSDTCPPQGKLRRNLRRLRKQIDDVGTIRVETVTDANELPQAYEHFLSVEASGWKGESSSATAINACDKLCAFYKSLLTPETGGLHPQINLLWCDDKCIAAQFGLQTNNCLSLLKIGYNEEYARYSPGYLLLESVLADTIERNIDTLSLVTSPPWADRWHPNTVPVWHLHYYNQSSMGTALHQFNKLKQFAKSQLKKAA